MCWGLWGGRRLPRGPFTPAPHEGTRPVVPLAISPSTKQVMVTVYCVIVNKFTMSYLQQIYFHYPHTPFRLEPRDVSSVLIWHSSRAVGFRPYTFLTNNLLFSRISNSLQSKGTTSQAYFVTFHIPLFRYIYIYMISNFMHSILYIPLPCKHIFCSSWNKAIVYACIF